MKLTDISRQLATAFAAVGVSSLVLVGCNNSSAPETTKEPVTEGSTAETKLLLATSILNTQKSSSVRPKATLLTWYATKLRAHLRLKVTKLS